MLPLSLVTIFLFSVDSGSVFRIGSAISRIGLIWATDIATPVSAANAPVTAP